MKRVSGKIDGARITKNDTVELFLQNADEAFYIPKLFLPEITEENINTYVGGDATIRYTVQAANTVIDAKPNADGDYGLVQTDGVIVRRKNDEGNEVEHILKAGDKYQEGDKIVLRKAKMQIQMASATRSREQLEAVKTMTETELLRAQMMKVLT